VWLGDPSDLEHAFEAIYLVPDGHPDKRTCLNNLANSFPSRFKHLGELNGHDEAISKFREAVDLTSDGRLDTPIYNLGNALFARFDYFGELSDLGKAILILREAVGLAPDGHPDASTYFPWPSLLVSSTSTSGVI